MIVELPLRTLQARLPFRVHRRYRHDFVYTTRNYGVRVMVRGNRVIKLFFIGRPNTAKIRDAGLEFIEQSVQVIQRSQ